MSSYSFFKYTFVSTVYLTLFYLYVTVLVIFIDRDESYLSSTGHVTGIGLFYFPSFLFVVEQVCPTRDRFVSTSLRAQLRER